LRLFSFGGYGLALAALALVVFGAIECPPERRRDYHNKEKSFICFLPLDVLYLSVTTLRGVEYSALNFNLTLTVAKRDDAYLTATSEK